MGKVENMAHFCFELLHDFDLLESNGRVERILHRSPEEWALMADTLENAYAKDASSIVRPSSHDVDLWLPFGSTEQLSQVPSYLFLFDRVRVLDPLYNSITWLTQDSDTSIEQLARWFNRSPMATRRDLETLSLRSAVLTAQKIDREIALYVEMRDLIEEGMLVPFLDQEHYSTDDVESLTNFGEALAFQLDPRNPNSIDQYVSQITELFPFIATALKFKSIFPQSQSENIDLGAETNKRQFDKITELAGSLYGLEGELLQKIQWPNPQDELLISTSKGVPPSVLLDIREQERDALERFRSIMNKRLLEMKSVVGTPEYAKLVKSLQLDQRAEIAEINLVAERIKRNYLRNFTFHIGIATIAAGATILSAVAATQNPLALIGLGLGSGGVSAAAAKIAESWIDFKSDLDKLREKDSYILWKVKQGK